MKYCSPISHRGDVRSQKRKKRKGEKDPLKCHRPEKDNIHGTLVRLLWRAAAPGLMPLRLPRAQGVMKGVIHSWLWSVRCMMKSLSDLPPLSLQHYHKRTVSVICIMLDVITNKPSSSSLSRCARAYCLVTGPVVRMKLRREI